MSDRFGFKGRQQNAANKTIVTKKLIVQEYKNRLKNSIKTINDNFERILSASKINCEDSVHRANSAGKLGENYAIKNELLARAALLVKATDELHMLTNDIREFLILRDFNFISNSITKADENFKKQQEVHEKAYSNLRMNISGLTAEIDRELIENSSFRY